MDVNIAKFSIGENMRIIITYDNIVEELRFVGEYKTNINNLYNWHVFEIRKILIDSLDEEKKNFSQILHEIKNNINRKIELINTLKKSFNDIDEIEIE